MPLARQGNLPSDARTCRHDVNRPPLSLVANPRFSHIEDLKGAVLGTTSMTEGAAIYTREMLAQNEPILSRRL